MPVLVHGSSAMLPRFVLPLPTSKVQQRELREILDHTANAVLFVTVEENQRDSILSKHKNPILSQETCGVVYKIKCAGSGRDLTKLMSEKQKDL